MRRRKISASLWSTDLSYLKEEMQKVDSYIDSYHLDIMDNHYVQGFLFSAPIIKAIRPYTNKDFDVHLMCDHPENLLEELTDAGADTFLLHYNTTDLENTIKIIKRYGEKVGLVVRLDESLDWILPYLSEVNVVVLMGTDLGIKGADIITAGSIIFENDYKKINEWYHKL